MKNQIQLNYSKPLIILATGLAVVSLQAQSLTWDPGLTGGSGGNGTWNLISAIWYNGTTDVRWMDTSSDGISQAVFSGTAGTVALGSSLSASNLQFTTTGYTLSGAATLTLGAGGIDASALSSGSTTIFTPLLLSSGQQLWQAGSGSTLAVNGAITRNTGVTVDFSSSGVTSPTLTDVNGVIGGWATVGGANSTAGDWAAMSGGSISIYSGYTAISSTSSTSQSGAGATTQNWFTGDPADVNNNVTTLTTTATLNSLVMQGDFGLDNGVTLTLGNGGLILRGASRWMLGSSCYLTTGNSTGELFVHAPDANSGGNWTIWPIIEDNGATPLVLVKDGVDIVKLGNMSTYTGGTIINAGTLASTCDALYGNGNASPGLITPFGAGAITVQNGAVLQLGNEPGNAFGSYHYPNNITVNNGGLYAWDASHRVEGNLTIGPGGATIGSTFDAPWETFAETNFPKALFIDGLVTGTGPLTVQDSPYGQSGNAWNTACAVFTSQGTAAQNTYSGTVTVNPFTVAGSGGSYLYLVGTDVMANATITLTGDNLASSGRMGIYTLLFGNGSVDGPGYVTIGGLAGSGSLLLADTILVSGGSGYLAGAPVALTVGNNNASTTYSGVMGGAGSLIKVGTGTLTLSGVNTNTGNTTVNGGTLALTGGWVSTLTNTVGAGATLDVSSLSGVTLSGSQVLRSSGAVKGSISTSAGTQIYADSGSGYGTNAIFGSLTLAEGAVAYLSVSTSAAGPDDLVIVAGTLTANNNIIHIKAPSTSVSLQPTDYTLFSSPSAVSGSFASAPSWDVPPVNAANFSIVTSGNTVKLHYTSCAGPTGAGTATPVTALRNQNLFISVTATNGSCGTVNSATLNASAIGGSSSVMLVSAGGNVWTNTVSVAASIPAGGETLVVTLTDTASLNGIVNIPLTVAVGNDVWKGAGGDNNFSDNLNWANGTAPGLVGDSLEFAGTTRLTPNMDNNYTVTSVTFDNGAGNFNIGTTDGSILTLTGSGPLVNNSANPQTLNVPLADSGGGLTKTGNGAIVLAGANTYTGPTVVNAGTLGIAGSLASTANISVGNTAGNAVLDLSGTLSPNYLWLGNVTNSVAAVYQTDGTVTATNDTGYDNLDIGNIQGAYGYYAALGGTINVNGVAVAGEDNSGSSNFGEPAGNGILDINGGTVNCTGWFVVSRNSIAQTGVVNLYSGSLSFAGGGFVNNWGSGQTTIINILGGTLSSSNDGEIGFLGGTGIVNLNGGVTTVNAINGAWAGANGQVNFNGGTLRAYTANTAFLYVTAADIYSGGAVIDNNGNPITIAQPLLAPSGNGVYGAAIANGGAGYIAPPIVTISGGGGSGATAVAQINPAAGTVTNILITCPGQNYTSAPTFTLTGGGATAPAVVNGVAPTANSSGGLTALGDNLLTLSGVNTYAGATVISNGTLSLTGSINNSTNIITGPGATFDVSTISLTLGDNQALSGWGTVSGPVNAAAGAKIYGGTDETYGTNIFGSSLTLAAGAACYLDVGTAYNGANDLLVVEGALTAGNNVIHLKAPSISSSLDTTADYVLIIAGSITGSFAAGPVWDVAPANAAHYSIVTGSTTVTLHYSATVASPTVTAAANPTTLVCNQATRIAANVTPGSASIASVTVDLTSIGGSVVTLVQSNTASVYTNMVTIPSAAPPGGATLTVVATDTASQSGSTGVPITIVASSEVWNGGGANQNWSSNPNWVSGYAPGTVGDSITFAGTTGLSPNMDNNYSIAGLTFSSNAGSFTLGSTAGDTLTLTGSGAIVNNSVNAQTLNVPIGDAGGGITKSGAGAITLDGNNTYAGPLTVNAGALTLAGSSASTANASVGSAAGNSVLNVSGSASLSPYYLLIGNVANAAGAVYQSAGTVTATANSGFDNLSVGNVAGAYGYYGANGGTITTAGICVGGENNTGSGPNFDAPGGNGIFEVNGGMVSDAGWLVIARQNGGTLEPSTGILNVYSGLLTYAGNGIVGPWDTNNSAIINILGGLVTNSANVGVLLGSAGFEGVLNLNGGVLQASLITGYYGPGYYNTVAGQLNFNGGTLRASGANVNFIAVSSATIYSGGATIDNNGTNIAIAQPLLAPTGNGVHGYQLASGGAGYIAPPILIVTNGAGDTTGTGATAIAQINPALGTVTNVIITCPGVNYTATPVFLVSGGGATSPAVINGVTPTANSSGGLTAVGSGVTTLSGANTYTGNTTVSAGTLEIVSPVLASGSTVSVASGAILQLDFATTNIVGALLLNGVAQVPGVYNAATSPAYITGSGSLLVPAPGPGRFTSPPGITHFNLSEANVVLNCSNGQANKAYYLLTSTNVSLPLHQWRTVATNVLSANGNFIFTGTNVVTSGSKQQFYILSNTNFNH